MVTKKAFISFPTVIKLDIKQKYVKLQRAQHKHISTLIFHSNLQNNVLPLKKEYQVPVYNVGDRFWKILVCKTNNPLQFVKQPSHSGRYFCLQYPIH